jgi:hypothetical protein
VGADDSRDPVREQAAHRADHFRMGVLVSCCIRTGGARQHERGLRHHRCSDVPGVGLDGGQAACRRGTDHPDRPEAAEQRHQRPRLRLALEVQRPEQVVAGPVLLVSGRGVPQHHQRDGPVRPPGEVVEHADVGGVGQPFEGARQREPAHVVDLVVGDERRRLAGKGRLGRGPELHPLGAAANQVVNGLQAAADQQPEPGLLGHLADRRLRQFLPRLAFALGQRPVVPPRAVDEQDLGSVRAAPPRHHARGLDLRERGQRVRARLAAVVSHRRTADAGPG